MICESKDFIGNIVPVVLREEKTASTWAISVNCLGKGLSVSAMNVGNSRAND